MSISDTVTDCEPKTRTSALRREERVENLRLKCVLNTRARVRDLKGDPNFACALDQAPPYCQVSSVPHSLDCIEEQI